MNSFLIGVLQNHNISVNYNNIKMLFQLLQNKRRLSKLIKKTSRSYIESS